MSNQAWAIVLVLVVLILGGVLWWMWAAEPAPVESGGTPDEEGSASVPAGDEASYFITYSDTGYSPSALTVPRGATVAFRNSSTKNMWPASAMHPTHGVYPTTGGCIGSTFDACQGIPPGGSWSFRFDVPGTWRYHDHLTPTFFGAVTVAE